MGTETDVLEENINTEVVSNSTQPALAQNTTTTVAPVTETTNTTQAAGGNLTTTVAPASSSLSLTATLTALVMALVL